MSRLFHVSEACEQMGLRAGAVVFRNAEILAADAELNELIYKTIKEKNYHKISNAEIKKIPEIERLHEIFRKSGVNPNRYPPSNERLIRSASKTGRIPTINSFVDAYNFISLKTLCTLGAHDMERLSFPISLSLTAGNESFIPLGQNEKLKIDSGEFAYIDAENRIICRMDLLQAEFSKVTDKTENVLLIIEGTDIMDRYYFERVFEETISLITGQTRASYDIIAYPI